jgi:predicted small metal-binding protein
MFWCNVIISIICIFVCIVMSRSEVTKYLKSNFEEVHGITSISPTLKKYMESHGIYLHLIIANKILTNKIKSNTRP